MLNVTIRWGLLPNTGIPRQEHQPMDMKLQRTLESHRVLQDNNYVKA